MKNETVSNESEILCQVHESLNKNEGFFKDMLALVKDDLEAKIPSNQIDLQEEPFKIDEF